MNNCGYSSVYSLTPWSWITDGPKAKWHGSSLTKFLKITKNNLNVIGNGII
jgi:hypothetical protein